MKTIEVVAAIIIEDGKVFATQRGYGEELNTDISVGTLLTTVEWDYPTFHLTMHCFTCKLESGTFSLNEHNDAAWLAKDTLESVKWLPADLAILDKIGEVL